MSILGDMLHYNLDMQSLEVYPSSVTQRKNAAAIYKLIGYKMKWYRSAVLSANIVNTYSSSATLPRFCTFKTETGITYTTFDSYELPSNTTNNGWETLIELIQGTPVTPVRSSNNPYPDVGKPWHSIYGYNYTADDIVNNRLYLKDQNIDQDHIMLIDDSGNEWTLKENIYLTTDVGRFFEFGVDVNDTPYLELVDYYGNFNITKFKVFYIRSDGENGQIYANTLNKLTGNVWSRQSQGNEQVVYNVSNFIHFTHYDSSLGYDPETPDEARKNSVVYQNTLDTLITLSDFEKATLREPGVANVRATDLTNDPGMVVSYYLGDLNKDSYIDEIDLDILENYLADPDNHPLTTYQKKLADVNQDGVIDSNDLTCLKAYLAGDTSNAGLTGIQEITNTELLSGFVVKLYILRTAEWEDVDDDTYSSMITTDLEDYKILPLTIDVDLHSIKKCYWTVKGTFFTREPLSRDDLQTIIVNINNNLRYKYSVTKVNFNTLINYKEVIETILDTDNRILMVDLDPITYTDENNEPVSKDAVTGVFTQVEPYEYGDINQDGFTDDLDVELLSKFLQDSSSYPLTEKQLQIADINQDGVIDGTDLKLLRAIVAKPEEYSKLRYDIKLENTPILPGSVMIKINEGQYTLRDNNNGHIYNVDSILTKKGTIDYLTGEIHFELVSPCYTDISIVYTKNATNIATYKNLSTQTFYFDTSSLQKDDTQDLV